jgi:hypothetical protein
MNVLESALILVATLSALWWAFARHRAPVALAGRRRHTPGQGAATERAASARLRRPPPAPPGPAPRGIAARARPARGVGRTPTRAPTAPWRGSAPIRARLSRRPSQLRRLTGSPVADAVANQSQPRPGDQRSHPDGQGRSVCPARHRRHDISSSPWHRTVGVESDRRASP